MAFKSISRTKIIFITLFTCLNPSTAGSICFVIGISVFSFHHLSLYHFFFSFSFYSPSPSLFLFFCISLSLFTSPWVYLFLSFGHSLSKRIDRWGLLTSRKEFALSRFLPLSPSLTLIFSLPTISRNARHCYNRACLNFSRVQYTFTNTSVFILNKLNFENDCWRSCMYFMFETSSLIYQKWNIP